MASSLTQRRRPAALVMALVVLAAGAAAFMGGGAGAAATPPFEPDPNATGFLTFYNASGSVVTSGNINDAPFAAYVQASSAGRQGDNKATLFGALPKNGQATGAWSSEAMSASTTYPNASAPGALGSSSLPLVTMTSNDETLATLQSDFPNTATDAYKGLYQLRIKTSGPGNPPGATYEETDIQIQGSTWTQVYPVPGSPTTTGAPTTSTTAGPTTSTTTGPTTSTTTGSTTSTTEVPTTSTTVGTGTTTTTVGTGTTTTTTAGGSVGVTDSSGNPLAPNATLTPGQQLKLTASGFTPNESVTIAVHSTTVTLATVNADGNGAVSATVTLPSDLAAGSHTLTLSGASVTDTYPFSIGASGNLGGTGGAADTSGVGSSGTPATPATSSAPLAFTGGQIAGLVGAALSLMVLGLSMVAGTRRRRPGTLR